MAYKSPLTPPRPPVLPRRGSSTAAAVILLQYPSSSNKKDYHKVQRSVEELFDEMMSPENLTRKRIFDKLTMASGAAA